MICFQHVYPLLRKQKKATCHQPPQDGTKGM